MPESRPEFEAELTEALLYYGWQSASAGERLLAEIQSALERIAAMPRMYQLHPEFGARRALLPEFPYSIWFRETNGEVLFLALSHHSRRPGYWLERR